MPAPNGFAGYGEALPPPPPAVLNVLPIAPRAAPSVTPSIGYGDVQLMGIPHDAAGRLVLVLSLLMAADLLAPWIAFDGDTITPSRFGLPVLFVAALLVAAAASVMYAPLRARLAYAAFPLVLGAAALGAATVLWLLVGPLASDVSARFVAHVLANPAVLRFTTVASSGPPTLALSPDAGLYAFLLGAAGLTIAGYQFLVSAAAANASLSLPALTATPPAAEEPPVSGAAEDASGLPIPQPLTRAAPQVAAPAVAPALTQTPPATDAPTTQTPAQTGLPPAVILPGTADWHRASETPANGRVAPPLRGLGRQGGPRG
jgi:hypothetical protein